MGFREVIVKRSAADNVAAVSWYIESKGMLATAERFTDAVYDFFLQLADKKVSYPVCREPSRAAFGYKCVSYKKKYTVVFIESENEILICEFLSSKLIYW